MHCKGYMAVGSMHRGQLPVEGVGIRLTVPVERANIIGADTGVIAIGNVGPNMEVIADNAVATMVVGNDNLHSGSVVRHCYAVILPSGGVVFNDGVIYSGGTIIKNCEMQRDGAVAAC